MTRSPRSKAAGCVVRRGDAVGIAVIHRPRYDDWSLPKGKLDPGETFEEAAVREVEEEIGVRGDARRRAAAHRVHRPQGPREDRPLLADGARRRARFEPNDEVDEVRWLAADEARALLTYDRDRDTLDAP